MTNGLQYLLWGTLLFATSFVVSAAVVIVVLAKLPAAYFLERPQRQLWIDQHPAVRLILHLLKNLLGLGLVAAGCLLSLPGVPGQGILTIVIGIMLLDFPGKHRWERKIVSQPRISRGDQPHSPYVWSTAVAVLRTGSICWPRGYPVKSIPECPPSRRTVRGHRR